MATSVRFRAICVIQTPLGAEDTIVAEYEATNPDTADPDLE